MELSRKITGIKDQWIRVQYYYNPGAVSYTHLDVYKRQEFHGGKRAAAQLSGF